MSNTEIVKTGMKTWESSDVQTMTELVADDFVLSGHTPQPLGKQEFIGLMQILHAGMPDIAFINALVALVAVEQIECRH